MHSLKSGSPISPSIRASHKPNSSSPAPVSKAKAWVMALRIQTLPAGSVPVLVGTAAAAADGTFRPLVFIAAMVASLLIQIGANLANDLFDFKKGADTEERLGPTRVTQAGLLTPSDVTRGMVVTFALAFLVGLYLVYVGGWPILLIGLASITAGILYTGGPWPLGYHGLGDLFVFIFFGLVAVMGTYYLHADIVTLNAFLASVPVGLLATALLVVNNLRDIDTDRVAGKRTLAVRMGEQATRIQYLMCIGIPFLVPVVLWLNDELSGLFWLSWLSLPMAISLLRTVFARTQGVALNAVLKKTGILQLIYGLLFAGSYLV